MLFYGAFRNTHAHRDFALGQALYFSEQKGLTALGRQGRNGVDDAFQLLPRFKLRVGERLAGGDLQRLPVCARGNRHDPRPPDLLKRQGGGDTEQIGPHFHDVLDAIDAHQLGIGFLDDVVDIAASTIVLPEPPTQSCFVRQDMFGEPGRAGAEIKRH